jgi:HlyD family secretion protein
MKRHLHRRAALGVGLLVLLATVYLLLRPSPVLVDAARVTRGPMEVTIDDEGETRVRDRYVITAPVAGRLARIDLREGDTVRAGATVACILPSPLDARAREAALARVAQAEDAQRAMDALVEQARAAQLQARRTSDRLNDLAGRNLVAPEERERAETESGGRARELESAEFRARAAAHDVEAARAALLAGSGNEVVVRAPSGGRVLRIPERSERVVAPGTPLLELGDARRIEVVVDLLSSDAVSVRAGQPLRVESWGGPRLAGRVRRVEPSGFTRVSALGVEEQRVNVIGDLDRPESALGDRYRVDVRIVIWAADSVLRVPASALFRVGDDWAAFLVDPDGRARRREITVGHRTGTVAEVRAGLESGDAVVLYPGDRVVDGVRVAVR